jgi:hypothetical protein
VKILLITSAVLSWCNRSSSPWYGVLFRQSRLREASGVVPLQNMAANREMTAGAIESLLKRSGSDTRVYKPFTDVTTGSTPETQATCASVQWNAAQKPSTNKANESIVCYTLRLVKVILCSAYKFSVPKH